MIPIQIGRLDNLLAQSHPKNPNGFRFSQVAFYGRLTLLKAKADTLRYNLDDGTGNIFVYCAAPSVDDDRERHCLERVSCPANFQYKAEISEILKSMKLNYDEQHRRPLNGNALIVGRVMPPSPNTDLAIWANKITEDNVRSRIVEIGFKQKLFHVGDACGFDY